MIIEVFILKFHVEAWSLVGLSCMSQFVYQSECVYVHQQNKGTKKTLDHPRRSKFKEPSQTAVIRVRGLDVLWLRESCSQIIL